MTDRGITARTAVQRWKGNSHERNNIYDNRMDDDGTECTNMAMDFVLGRFCVRSADMDFGED